MNAVQEQVKENEIKNFNPGAFQDSPTVADGDKLVGNTPVMIGPWLTDCKVYLAFDETGKAVGYSMYTVGNKLVAIGEVVVKPMRKLAEGEAETLDRYQVVTTKKIELATQDPAMAKIYNRSKLVNNAVRYGVIALSTTIQVGIFYGFYRWGHANGMKQAAVTNNGGPVRQTQPASLAN